MWNSKILYFIEINIYDYILMLRHSDKKNTRLLSEWITVALKTQ